MTLETFKWLAVGLLLLSALIGGLLPWRFKRTTHVEFWFSLGNAFAGGVFLSVGLIHMLGEGASAFAEVWPDVEYPVVYLLAGSAFMGLLLLERVGVGHHEFDEVAIARRHENGEEPIALSAYVLLATLSIHSVMAGLALGVQSELEDAAVILIALLAHKGIAAFALGISLFRTNVTFRSGLFYLLLFSAMTPLGVAGGVFFFDIFDSESREAAEAIFNALAAGTFLYIAALDIFSEEFLRPRHRVVKYLASCLGFAAMALVALWT